MKAILIINMPDTCEDCQLRSYNQCYGLRYNRTIIEKWDGSDEFKLRNKICPLKPIPQKKNTNIRFSTIYSERIGYNSCIDEILGGRNEHNYKKG